MAQPGCLAWTGIRAGRSGAGVGWSGLASLASLLLFAPLDNRLLSKRYFGAVTSRPAPKTRHRPGAVLIK